MARHAVYAISSILAQTVRLPGRLRPGFSVATRSPAQQSVGKAAGNPAPGVDGTNRIKDAQRAIPRRFGSSQLSARTGCRVCPSLLWDPTSTSRVGTDGIPSGSGVRSRTASRGVG